MIELIDHKGLSSFNLYSQGLKRVLGSLEAEIMEIIWQTGTVTIRDVYENIAADRPISFNTVMTVMQRLAQKGLLKRQKGRRAYLFEPVESREEFTKRVTKEVSRGLIADFGMGAVSQFVHVLGEIDQDYLDKLEDLIKEIKRKEDETT
jgi:predicted transcriptional regulator